MNAIDIISYPTFLASFLEESIQTASINKEETLW